MQTHQADARTDLYGMGAIAYFLLTGQPPFVSDDAMAVMVAHARDPVVPPSRLRPGVPDDLERIVLRCLEKNPGARFQDARSLATALDSCAQAKGWSAEQAALWWRSHEPAVSIQETMAGTTQIPTRPVLASSTLSSDEAPTLGASSIELNVGENSADGLGLSLSIGEDQARPERPR
jgi:serine/threonine protein kinase